LQIIDANGNEIDDGDVVRSLKGQPLVVKTRKQMTIELTTLGGSKISTELATESRVGQLKQLVGIKLGGLEPGLLKITGANGDIGNSTPVSFLHGQLLNLVVRGWSCVPLMRTPYQKIRWFLSMGFQRSLTITTVVLAPRSGSSSIRESNTPRGETFSKPRIGRLIQRLAPWNPEEARSYKSDM
jgi:hypothetical protein